MDVDVRQGPLQLAKRELLPIGGQGGGDDNEDLLGSGEGGEEVIFEDFWCVLSPSTLNYFRGEGGEEAGLIELQDCSVEITPE